MGNDFPRNSAGETIMQALQGTPTFVRELIAGGTAGGIAKTSIAPLERVKILFQTGQVEKGSSVWRIIYNIASKEGLRGLFRGNSATVTRIIPYSAFHFWAYEHFRRVFFAEALARGLQQGPWLDLLAGSAAGATAVTLTYPLDLVRTRLAWHVPKGVKLSSTEEHAFALGNTKRANCTERVTRKLHRGTDHTHNFFNSLRKEQTLHPGFRDVSRRCGGYSSRYCLQSSGSSTPSMLGTASKVISHEGFRGLYSGIGATLWGILPYAGIKFYVYQSLKQQYRHLALTETSTGSTARLPIPLMLTFGAVSGLVGQTLTYPLDIVRRRMQVQGAEVYPRTNIETSTTKLYRSTIDCLVGIWRSEGPSALFRGLHINYIKVVPSTALGFMIYDYMKSVLLLSNHI
uniref:Solute carrier family 25 (Mitochondrial carrier protein), member 16 n=2 Tax=Tetraselmis sp. GSL018 TaxID=582737 RepID=A0A061RJD1_9CHLO|eukprot:CAMPEP_0177578718 /NCGR_PEP_ID=MMETSP0419_2-20121207/511_1 /TAXON_ID=582737 /ORGANISM="Tetraselmis sp., Strain GSL018" /LENGTH=401 /DNA_ID=CAMNT_0019067207 /DNA_START=376 /DNA_END=1581 /DNA_ORIENTATION=+